MASQLASFFHARPWALLPAFFLILFTSSAGADEQSELAKTGYQFLKKYCHGCHGVNQDVPGFVVLDREILVGATTPTDKKIPYINLEVPEKSQIWLRAVKSKTMPPEHASLFPTEEERQQLAAWMRAGAPFPVDEERKFVSDKDVLSTIRNDLQSLALPEDAVYMRYLVLTNLHNDRNVTTEQLRLTRAATSKVLNSLSWKPRITKPMILDKETQVVLRFDLRDYGWDMKTWEAIFATYPYGVRHSEDRPIELIEKDIEHKSGHNHPYVRADWFVANVTRPPLYDKIMQLPATLKDLESKLLFVDVEDNFRKGQLLRAGMINSGVSRNNRMVERHETRYGAYWRSYDFSTNDLQGNIVRFPLGPKFKGNEFERHAFQHAGGEVIFSLPNQLHGYMLADDKDKRLDAPAPIEIVRDRAERAGTPQVVNGLSCMGCHQRGIIRFKDEISKFPAIFGTPRQHMQRLFPTQEKMDEILDTDTEAYLGAAAKTTAEFLQIGADADRKITAFPEPIEEVARLYLKDLTIASAAAELGYSSPDELRAVINGNSELRELGLGPLLASGGLKRQLWQRAGYSLYHQIAIRIGLNKISSTSN